MAGNIDPLMDSRPRCMSLEEEDEDHLKVFDQVPIYSQRRIRSSSEAIRRSTDVSAWDIFRIMPDAINESNQEGCVDKCLQVIKILAYIFTFFIVLSCALISKSTLLFMTSHIRLKKNLSLCGSEGVIQELPKSEVVAWIWALFFSICLPEVFTFLKCLRKVLFKLKSRPRRIFIFLAVLFETVHTLGVVMLIFFVLPEIDVVKGAVLLQGVCLVPGILNTMARSNEESSCGLSRFADILSIFGQLSIFLLLGLDFTYWKAVVALILISFAWWENYVEKKSSLFFISTLGKLKDELRKTRHSLYAFLCPGKILLTLGLLIGAWKLQGESASDLFMLDIFDTHNITIKWKSYTIGLLSTKDPLTPLYVTCIQVFSGLICYFAGKFACRIQIQPFSFALPLTLVTPLLVCFLLFGCAMKSETKCFISLIPKYLFWNCRKEGYLNNWYLEQDSWIFYLAILWLLSQTWITRHIWISSFNKLEETNKLFVLPYYNGLLIDQSLALNRRRNEETRAKRPINQGYINSAYHDTDSNEMEKYYSGGAIINEIKDREENTKDNDYEKGSEEITKIYACATMWHETADEMLQMLKSIMRMDQDQCHRRIMQEFSDKLDPDYYEYETHIFFDDAFEISDVCDEWSQINKFVLLLIHTLPEAATEVHQTKIKHMKMKKIPTPYGGRLEWTLPGKTKLIAHLKDKSKIRHRKRWSQVMYMYYLLGFKLMGMPCPQEVKSQMSRNTFILALDGDIDFKPKAVTLLVDLMKKNYKLGSACGRIHPIGPGPMVWFQKFEYAIGHWLQKATEHIIGCVLCSPGCFSIFRAQALIDDNVMAKYTTTSTEAMDYVQFDQGEDRWLCTLILQRGYRIEYCAASDAYTHAPEGFDEFFNQRRRWVPSTMANIMDLLLHCRGTIAINNSLSMLYIIYQAVLMFGTIIGPGTIFLMITGALNSVFPYDITIWQAFWINFAIVFFFSLSCFLASRKVQMFLAQAFTTTYCFMMMAVFVGTVLQFKSEFGSPPTLFTTILFGIFFFSAIIHPQEMLIVLTFIPLLLYWLLIPSMYLLLNIYSLVNMNDVSWGTREGVVKKTKAEIDQEKKDEEELKKQAKSSNAVFDFLKNTLNSGNAKEDNGVSFGFGNICRCLLCWAPSDDITKQELLRITQSLEQIKTDITKLNKKGLRAVTRKLSNLSFRSNILEEPMETVTQIEDMIFEPSDDELDESSKDLMPERDEIKNPYWIEHPDLRFSSLQELDLMEVDFWKDLIKKYLEPIDEDKKKQAEVAAELLQLRNKVAFGFFILNGLFIILIFMLQLAPELRFCMDKFIESSSSKNATFCKPNQYELEPIGLAFVFLFAAILVIQFMAMIVHRFDTLSHLLATTSITLFSRKEEREKQDRDNERNERFSIVRKFANLNFANSLKDSESNKNIANNSSIESVEEILQRDPIKKIYKSQKIHRVESIDKAFRKNLEYYHPEAEAKLNLRPTSKDSKTFRTRRQSQHINLMYKKTFKTKASITDNGEVIKPDETSIDIETHPRVTFNTEPIEISISIETETETEKL